MLIANSDYLRPVVGLNKGDNISIKWKHKDKLEIAVIARICIGHDPRVARMELRLDNGYSRIYYLPDEDMNIAVISLAI